VLALLFPGQGSQRPGMGLAWRDHRSWAVVERIAAATGRDLAVLLTEADAETLRATRNAQLAAFGLSMVILDAARSAGLAEPVVAAGHSLGEYSALVAAGVLSLEDGARLVAARGEAMQGAAEQLPGTMAAVLGLDPQGVAEACAGVEGAWVANDNAPGQVVVAGTAEGVAAAGEAARAAGAKRVLPLAVGGAFHSPLMAPAQEPLDAALAGADFGPASFPVVTNLDATAHTDGWRPLLSGQLASPVRWRESLLALGALGVDRFVELGPGSELSGMVRRTVEGAIRANAAAPEDLPGALAVSAGTEP
jgi:[acyl-carrier-protein] S-malonyltransferase